MKKSDIGLIGLAVMGENLVMNMESKGFTVSVYNRTQEKVKNFVEGRAKGKNIVGTYSLEELVASLEKPRKVMMMIKAGSAVDSMIEQLIPLLEEGDIIIDGGNSHFPDTTRRTAYVESKGLLYIGTGVSGGEEGALKGPSMMPVNDKIASLVTAMHSNNVQSTMCNGKWLMRDRVILTLDEEAILKEACARGAAIYDRAGIKLPDRFPVVKV